MELTEGKVRLREFSMADSGSLALLANNKNIWDNVRDILPHPYRKKDAISFIRKCQAETPQMTFAIEYAGAFCGVTGMIRMEDVYRYTAEVGYWIGEPFWNKGIATKALKLITEYGFGLLKLIRIQASVFETNEASKKVLEKCGYQLEGISKMAVMKKGVIMDEFRYGKYREPDVSDKQR
ncbi:MAG: GNAT family N-acetyltransferase [Chlorobi bacterium]|nr:GNAT family N-acetyltransferase [Chlorobiota bacterium]